MTERLQSVGTRIHCEIELHKKTVEGDPGWFEARVFVQEDPAADHVQLALGLSRNQHRAVGIALGKMQDYFFKRAWE